MSGINAPLVFVNKKPTSSSLSRSSSGERALIFSHVQQQRRRRRPNARDMPWLKYTAQVPLEHLSEEVLQEDPHQQSHTLNATPSFNGSDPFHCTIVGFDAGNHATLRFAFGEGVKSTFQSEAFAPTASARIVRGMRHQDIIDQRLANCIGDEALMYSTLAYGACCHGWMAGIIRDDKPPEYFIGKALQAVRVRLSGEAQPRIDNWLLLTMYSLAITHLWVNTPALWARCPKRQAEMLHDGQSETQASRTHLVAMLRLVDRVGGWDYFDSYILESAILVDKFHSIAKFETPVIPLTWDPGPLSIDGLPSHSVEANRPTNNGFTTIAINIELGQLLHDISEYIHLAERCWSDRPSYPTERRLFLRLQALIYRLLSLTNLDDFNNAVRLAAMIFLLSTTEYQGAQVSAATLLRRLRSALIAAKFWEKSFDSGLRIWCLLTAAGLLVQSREAEWFLSLAIIYLQSAYISFNAENLQQVMCKFLFLPSRQQHRYSQLRGLYFVDLV